MMGVDVEGNLAVCFVRRSGPGNARAQFLAGMSLKCGHWCEHLYMMGCCRCANHHAPVPFCFICATRETP